MNKRPVVLVVMDGVGERKEEFGNAVKGIAKEYEGCSVGGSTENCTLIKL